MEWQSSQNTLIYPNQTSARVAVCSVWIKVVQKGGHQNTQFSYFQTEKSLNDWGDAFGIFYVFGKLLQYDA